MDKDIAEKIAKELNITDEDFQSRKLFLQITEEDIRNIKKLGAALGGIPEEMFRNFYKHLMSFEQTRLFFSGSDQIERLIEKQKKYFAELLSGEYDRNYLLTRLYVGYKHVELNVVPLWYIGAFNKYTDEIRKLVGRVKDRIDEEATVESIRKIITMDIVLTLESYHYAKYKLQEELKRMVVTDELTGIFNRRKLDELIEYEIDKGIRFEKPLSLIMLDIDHFKEVNDTFGHDTGDVVLREMADGIRRLLREEDYLIRYGGEEFLVILTNTPLEKAKNVAERIREAVSRMRFKKVGGITVSLGVAEYNKGEKKEKLLKRADKNLYMAKKQGRNRTCW